MSLKKHRLFAFFALLVGAPSLVARAHPPLPEWEAKSPRPYVRQLKQDYSWMASLRWDPSPREDVMMSAFDSFFGGFESTHLLNYFETRVRYLNMRPTQEAKLSRSAENLGAILWKKGLTEKQIKETQFGQKTLKIESPRIGLVTLFPSYFELPSAAQRMGILLHEGRHSDCESPEQCGHSHALCPPNHELAGYLACDDSPRGAYHYEFIFNAMIAHRCKKCSKREKQAALMSSFDRQSRLTFLQSHESPFLIRDRRTP